MWRWLGKSALSSAGVLIMFGAQIGPDDAEINLCKWVRLAFASVPEHCLADRFTSAEISAVGAIMLFAGISWFGWDFFRRRRKSHDAVLPPPTKTVWPDYQKWDAVDPLEVFQAACLWADEEPKLPWPSRAAEKVYQKINEYGHRPDIILPVSSGETTREAIKEAIETQRSGLVNPRGRISRDDLKRIAEAWGEKPKFLYPRSRL